MPLPTTITGAVFGSQHCFPGPFLDGNDNVYLILRDSGDDTLLEAWKATDPTDSFADTDAGDADQPTAETHLGWFVYQQGTKLLICSQSNNAAGSDVKFHRFATSDDGAAADEWDIGDESVISYSGNDNPADGLQNSAITRRNVSNDEIVIIHQGANDRNKGTNYARVDYSRAAENDAQRGIDGWTTGVSVDGAAGDAQVNYHSGTVAKEEGSTLCHFLWRDDTNTDLKHRSLNSSNTLSSIENVDTSMTAIDAVVAGRGVGITDGATERVRFPYPTAIAASVAVARIDNDGTPATTIIADAANAQLNTRNTYCLAKDGTDLKAMWIDDLTGDIERDEAATPHTSWGTDVTEETGTFDHVSCEVYTRSGSKVWAFARETGSDTVYHEISLASPASLPYRPNPLRGLIPR